MKKYKVIRLEKDNSDVVINLNGQRKTFKNNSIVELTDSQVAILRGAFYNKYLSGEVTATKGLDYEIVHRFLVEEIKDEIVIDKPSEVEKLAEDIKAEAEVDKKASKRGQNKKKVNTELKDLEKEIENL